MAKEWGDVGVEYWFLSLTLCVGALLVFFTPPFQAPDEDSHFKRAYALSEGAIVAVNQGGVSGHFLPRDILDFEQAHRRMIGNLSEKYTFSELYTWSAAKKVDPSNRVFASYSSASSSFLMYIPQALGVWLGRHLGNGSPLVMMHLGRFFNLILFCCAIFWTIRLLPVARVGAGMLSIMPMTIHLASSLSYDVSVISACFLTTAYLLKLVLDGEHRRIEGRVLGFLILASILLAHYKTVYFSIMGLLLLVPAERFARYSRFKVLGLVFSVGPLSILFSQFIDHLLGNNSQKNIYVQRQISWILNNPIGGIATIPRSLIRNFTFYHESFIGKFGWLDTNPPSAFIVLYSLALILVFIIERPSIALSWQLRSILVSAVLVTAAFIFGFFYVNWTPLPGHMGVGSPIVDGVQGRYFIPLAMMAGLVISGPPVIWVGRNRLCWTLIKVFSVFSCGITVFTVVSRYFW